MTDTFNVTASWSAGSYTAGQTITGTISGSASATTTTTTTANAGPVTIPVVSADGSQSAVTIAAVPVTTTTTSTTTEAVVIDTTRAIVDSGSPARAWTVSANKLSITATA
jgi:hypothetical protein